MKPGTAVHLLFPSGLLQSEAMYPRLSTAVSPRGEGSQGVKKARTSLMAVTVLVLGIGIRFSNLRKNETTRQTKILNFLV